MLLQENVPLAPLTTLKVGGPARYLVTARTKTDVSEALEFSYSRNVPLFVLGGGSNVLIADTGWPGLVLAIAIAGIQEKGTKDHVVFEVGAGEEWDKFVACAVARNCAGIECLSGIPGTVGGTPVQNVGAYGQEVSETIESVLAMNRITGKVQEFSNQACGFAYRTSIFNTSGRDTFIILGATYSLALGGVPHIEYADLKKYFAGWNLPPTLTDTRDAVRNIRASKGMLISPHDEDCRSAGSFFKNPVLSDKQFRELSARAAEKKLQIPAYPALESQRKISAAWLLEHSGFGRGFDHGRVGLSRKHALAIVNRASATAADVLALKNLIQERVEDLWGVSLQPEPVFVGF